MDTSPGECTLCDTAPVIWSVECHAKVIHLTIHSNNGYIRMIDSFTEKASVLVVDDTPDNLSLMSGSLKDRYRVKVANNGEKAIKIVQGDSPPDLILLDIMMPGLSGYDVCKVLKADPATRDVPIIFLTAMTATEDEKKGARNGSRRFHHQTCQPTHCACTGGHPVADQGSGRFSERPERLSNT